MKINEKTKSLKRMSSEELDIEVDETVEEMRNASLNKASYRIEAIEKALEIEIAARKIREALEHDVDRWDSIREDLDAAEAVAEAVADQDRLLSYRTDVVGLALSLQDAIQRRSKSAAELRDLKANLDDCREIFAERGHILTPERPED